MGHLKIQIPDEVEKRFREFAMRRYGHKKGALSIAAEDALEKWTSGNEKKEIAKSVARKITKNPVDEIEGLLSHVKGKTSVQLQHEAGKIRAKTALEYLKKRK